MFNNTTTTKIYTLSLHDALPISKLPRAPGPGRGKKNAAAPESFLKVIAAEGIRYFSKDSGADRKSTRLNSSHVAISYAVFCLKKKNTVIHLLLEAEQCVLAKSRK